MKKRFIALAIAQLAFMQIAFAAMPTAVTEDDFVNSEQLVVSLDNVNVHSPQDSLTLKDESIHDLEEALKIDAKADQYVKTANTYVIITVSDSQLMAIVDSFLKLSHDGKNTRMISEKPKKQSAFGQKISDSQKVRDLANSSILFSND